MGGSGRRWEGRRFTNEKLLLVYRRILEGRSYLQVSPNLNTLSEAGEPRSCWTRFFHISRAPA